MEAEKSLCEEWKSKRYRWKRAEPVGAATGRTQEHVPNAACSLGIRIKWIEEKVNISSYSTDAIGNKLFILYRKRGKKSEKNLAKKMKAPEDVGRAIS